MITTDAKAGPYKVVGKCIEGFGESMYAGRTVNCVYWCNKLNTAYAQGQRAADARLVEACSAIAAACDEINREDCLQVEFNRTTAASILHPALSKCVASLSAHAGYSAGYSDGFEAAKKACFAGIERGLRLDSITTAEGAIDQRSAAPAGHTFKPCPPGQEAGPCE